LISLSWQEEGERFCNIYFCEVLRWVLSGQLLSLLTVHNYYCACRSFRHFTSICNCLFKFSSFKNSGASHAHFIIFHMVELASNFALFINLNLPWDIP
jgi:hypothetical protein